MTARLDASDHRCPQRQQLSWGERLQRQQHGMGEWICQVRVRVVRWMWRTLLGYPWQMGWNCVAHRTPPLCSCLHTRPL